MLRNRQLLALWIIVFALVGAIAAPSASAAEWRKVKIMTAACKTDNATFLVARNADPYCVTKAAKITFRCMAGRPCPQPLTATAIWAYSFEKRSWRAFDADTVLWAYPYGIGGWTYIGTAEDGIFVTKSKFVRNV